MNALKVLFLAVALALSAIPGWAQTTTTTTTITEPLTNTNGTSVVVASATGITASTASAQRFVLVDRELMQVRTVSGTTLTVMRGVGGTAATEHADNANLIFGPAGTWNPATGSARGVFVTGAAPIGTCTAGESEYLPVFHVPTAGQYDCLSSEWRPLVDRFTAALIFEGATNNASETTLTITEPTADRTVTIPDQTGNVLLFANANTQDVSIILEGATADAFETTLTATDPTADRTVTLPDAGGTVMLSSLATNGADAANAVTGASNALVFEGATADAFEISLAPEDAGADATVSIPATTGNMLVVGGTVGSSEITLTNVDLDTTDNSIAAHVCEDQASVTATGVVATDTLIWTMTTTDLGVTFSIGAIVPGAGVVTIRTCNNSAGAVDPGATADFRIFRIPTSQ